MKTLGKNKSDIGHILSETDFDRANMNDRTIILFTNYLSDDILSGNKTTIILDTYTGYQIECSLEALHFLFYNKNIDWNKIDAATLARIKDNRIGMKRYLYDEWCNITGTNHMETEGHMCEDDFVIYRSDEKNTSKYGIVLKLETILI